MVSTGTEFIEMESPDTRPLLGEKQLADLHRYGTAADVSRGDLLFTDGDEGYDLIVVLDGRVEIVDNLGTPDEEVVIGTLSSRGPWARSACSPVSVFSSPPG